MSNGKELKVIEEKVQMMEEITHGLNDLLDSIENDISESAERIRQELQLNRATIISSLDKMLNDIQELKQELQDN